MIKEFGFSSKNNNYYYLITMPFPVIPRVGDIIIFDGDYKEIIEDFFINYVYHPAVSKRVINDFDHIISFYEDKNDIVHGKLHEELKFRVTTITYVVKEIDGKEAKVQVGLEVYNE